MSAPTRADWPLLALDTAEDGVLTPVQMQKALFLLEKQAHDLIPTDRKFLRVEFNCTNGRYCRPTRQPFRGRLLLDEMSEVIRPDATPG